MGEMSALVPLKGSVWIAAQRQAQQRVLDATEDLRFLEGEGGFVRKTGRPFDAG